MKRGATLLYVGARLPRLSETFVYREVLALRDRGWDVVVASVHKPDRDLGDPSLDRLAEEAVPIYGAGVFSLLADAAMELFQAPLRGARTLGMAIGDALTGPDVSASRRPKILLQGLAGLALARRVRGRGIEHIHAHMAHNPTTIAMYTARQLGITFSMTPHAVDIFQHRTLLGRKLRRAAFVCCISTWNREFFRGIVDRPDEAYPLVRCGVDVGQFAPDRSADSDVSLLAVGRLIPKKGFDVLIQAVGRLAPEHKDLLCDIVGDGLQRDELKSLVDKLPPGARVELLGIRDNEWVKRRFRQRPIVVLPCRVDEAGDRDGIPVVLIEAMACECAVIAGDLPAIRELVIHEQTGLTVEPGSVDALVSAISRLIADPTLREQLGRDGRRQVLDGFALDSNIDRLEYAYDRVGSNAAADRGTGCELSAMAPDSQHDPTLAHDTRSIGKPGGNE